MIKAGWGLYERCSYCGSIVKLNKFLFGSMHICLTEEEQKRYGARYKKPLQLTDMK